ncbi:hypothetical protein [Microbulbifer thermotolerans]|uniref:hypothetical protein n=1 Tax=Microbulbifer thermotolerans TaxID=252514 RepID=UPI002248D392|nr:hypothetical protein [Microbulbifer thermotolerans]MCX2831462.1 hypothetical protein [Microbulbifer thermotolerans]
MINKIFKSVDLDSYTYSKYYSGFFSVDYKDVDILLEVIDRLKICETGDLFIGYVYIPDKVCLVNQYEYTDSMYEDIVCPLLNCPIFESEGFNFSLEDSCEAFKTCGCDSGILKRYAEMVLKYGGPYNHFFVLNEKLEYLIYLSDDPAIGAIGYSLSGRYYGKKFIERVKKEMKKCVNGKG